MKRSAEPFLDDVSPDPAKVARFDKLQQLLNKDNKDEILAELYQMVAENNITFIDLTYQSQEGPNKDTSVLWWLAANNKPEAFLAVWDKYKDNPNPTLQLPLLEGLLAQVQEGAHKGISALWRLALGAAYGKPAAFLAVWDKYKNNPDLESQLLEGLLMQAQEGGAKGKSALWLLAKGVANGRPEVFLPVWEKFKENIALQSQLLKALFTQVPQTGSPFFDANKDRSALSWLIDKNKDEPIRQILKDIFVLIPGCVPVDDVVYNADIEKLIYLKMVTSELIHARNAFFSALESAKKQSTLTQVGVESLMELADEAQQQGYVNAFYDLGYFIDLFEQEGDLLAPVADEVYERVSPLSPHYEWACIRCAENKFNLARFDEEQRNTLLCDSLRIAIDIKERNARLNSIRQVASLYVFGPNYLRFQLPIDDEQLLLMRDKNSIERYFSYFDEVKKIVEGTKDLDRQMEAVKALTVVFPLKQDNSLCAAPVVSPSNDEIDEAKKIVEEQKELQKQIIFPLEQRNSMLIGFGQVSATQTASPKKCGFFDRVTQIMMKLRRYI